MVVELSSPATEKSESKLAAKAAQTRALLIKTALKLLASQDFRRMSLDAIAAEAGVTKGAIYGHFKSKDDLMVAALFSRAESRPDTLVWPEGRQGTVRQRLRRLGEAVLAQRNGAGASSGAIAAEIMAYALTHEKLKGQVGKILTQAHEGMEPKILKLFAPDELPMPVESFALMLGALIPGVLFVRAFRGERLSDETVLAMFEGLAGS
jgi:AcrR family transcriptional regulator